MNILEAGALLRAKKISSAELVRQALTAIERLNPRLNAFLTVMGEPALAAAKKRDEELAAGIDLGPLHGLPVAVKDMYCTRGVLTTSGSKIFGCHVPDHDAAVVERLNSAGAILVGKTNQHELAYGITSNNPHYGAVRNPWDTDCIPGGSSGGSGAAVAAGISFIAMGSDTGGSIRIPASYCGVVGLKPTTGRVSRFGAIPLDFTLDHMGPLTRTVRDAAITLRVIAGYDPRDESSSRVPVPDYLAACEGASIKGLRLGVPRNFYFDHADPEVKDAVLRLASAAERLGAVLVECNVPDIAAMNTIGRVILLSEASAVMAPYVSQRDKFGADVLALLDQGRLLPATSYINAQRLRRIYQQQFRSVWKDIDILLTPATPITAPRIGQNEVALGGAIEDVRLASTRLVRAVNVLGLPALSIPCGLSKLNLPIGAQLIGPAWSEARLLRAGAALEDSGATLLRQPPVTA
jgi:aspartyl-tRNA(Asn)/glutamyl-tRNA(Gln) amidotransferase subunit A